MYIVLAVQQRIEAAVWMTRPGRATSPCHGCLGLATLMPSLNAPHAVQPHVLLLGWLGSTSPPRRLSRRRLPSDVLPCASSLP
jgi:hypothetical protein